MDTTTLLLSLIFGAAGFGYLTFGRKTSLIVPAVCGLVLMVCPYFFTSSLLMSLFCLAVMGVPFVVRDV